MFFPKLIDECLITTNMHDETTLLEHRDSYKNIMQKAITIKKYFEIQQYIGYKKKELS